MTATPTFETPCLFRSSNPIASQLNFSSSILANPISGRLRRKPAGAQILHSTKNLLQSPGDLELPGLLEGAPGHGSKEMSFEVLSNPNQSGISGFSKSSREQSIDGMKLAHMGGLCFFSFIQWHCSIWCLFSIPHIFLGFGEASQDSPSTTAMSTLPVWLSHKTLEQREAKTNRCTVSVPKCATGDQGVTGEGNKWISLLNIVFYNLQQSLE